MGIFDMFSNRNERAGRNEQIGGLRRGRNEVYKYLDRGEGDLRSQYGAADRLYAPLYNRYNAGSAMYSDALGLGGDEGRTRARAAFRTGPGYEFQRDEALQGVLRNASALGNIASGNTAIALTDRASSLADQEYDDWLAGLAGYDDKLMGVTGARAGIHTGLGNQLLDINRDRAGTGWATETGIGNARSNYELSKDRTSSNIFGALTGGLRFGSRLLGLGR